MQFMADFIATAWDSTMPLVIKVPVRSYIANKDMLFLIILIGSISDYMVPSVHNAHGNTLSTQHYAFTTGDPVSSNDVNW